MDVTAFPTPGAPVTLENLGKVYPDGTVAVGDISLEVRGGELVVLAGPPGCGASTILRMLNRLIEPSKGRVLLGGADIAERDPLDLRRHIGYAIRSVGLFPHQSVRTNVGTVPRLLGWDRKRTRARADEVLDLVGLDPDRHGGCYPHELSGPELRLAGLARALAPDPLVLLMDEPFAAVDPAGRARLREELLRVQAVVGKTVVLVTHDIDEAVRLGDRVAVLGEHGRLLQYAAPAELLGEPASAAVRDLVGRDRGVRRLAVTPVRAVMRPLGRVEEIERLPTVSADGTLYDALSAMLTSDSLNVVVERAGRPIGSVSRSALFDVPSAQAAART